MSTCVWPGVPFAPLSRILVVGFRLWRRSLIVAGLFVCGWDYNRASVATLQQNRSLTGTSKQILLRSKARFCFGVVLGGDLGQLLAFILRAAGERDAAVVVIGFFRLSVVEIGRFSVTVQLSDISHVVQGECVFGGEFIGLLEEFACSRAIVAV